jgi:hypothetical protein
MASVQHGYNENCDFPHNKVYKYSRLNLRRSIHRERGFSIHQKINFNYHLSEPDEVKYFRDMIYCPDCQSGMCKRSKVKEWSVKQYRDIYRGLTIDRVWQESRNRNYIEPRKDLCEACQEPSAGSYYIINENYCKTCLSFKGRYQNRTGDKTVEGWLSWSLSTETAYMKYIRSLKHDKQS